MLSQDAKIMVCPIWQLLVLTQAQLKSNATKQLQDLENQSHIAGNESPREVAHAKIQENKGIILKYSKIQEQ